MGTKRTKADLERELEELRAALKLRDAIIERLLTTTPAPQVVPLPYPVPAAPAPAVPLPHPVPLLPPQWPYDSTIICVAGTSAPNTTGCVRPELVCGGPQRPHPDMVFGGGLH